MTELKTLKDMREYTREGKKAKSPLRWINVYDLKAEAVKWVKQHRNIRPNWAKETNEEFFKAFFNLTEEDLKNDNKRNK